METATKVTHALVRAAGLAVTVLGVLVAIDQTPTLLDVFMLAAIALMVLLWALAFLAARAGVQAGLVAFMILVGIAVPAIGLTGEWRLYALAGLGAILESEDLVARIRRARLARPAGT